MAEERYRVLAIATHPVQYMAPLLRRLAVHPALDLQVAYCSLRGAESGHDPEFEADIQWDVPLLDGYSWLEVPNRGSGKESFLGVRNSGLMKLIRKGNYDAVLCFVGYVRATFWIACLAAHSSETAFLFGCDQGSLEPRDGRAWKRALKKRAWPILYRLADHVVVSSNNAKDLVHSLGIREERITLTPLAVDNEWWMRRSAEVDRTAVRESWGAGAQDLVILFCAKLQPWKRPLDLLRAFAQAKIAGGLLVFAGEGPQRRQLGEEAARLGVASRVRFLGFVNQSQLPAVYTSADLMVLPSEFEPFGAVVNEAMCCGCATAASDRCGAARDLVAPVSQELVFRCGDADAIMKILREASADRARLRAIGQAARRHIQTWSQEQNIAGTVDAVRIAAGRKHRAPSRTVPERAPSQTAPSASHKLPE